MAGITVRLLVKDRDNLSKLFTGWLSPTECSELPEPLPEYRLVVVSVGEGEVLVERKNSGYAVSFKTWGPREACLFILHVLDCFYFASPAVRVGRKASEPATEALNRLWKQATA